MSSFAAGYSIQDVLGRVSEADLEAQLVDWDSRPWKTTLRTFGVDGIIQRLEEEWAASDGIRRSFVGSVGADEPRNLLVASMAWGFGSVPYGPSRTAKMLERDGALDEIVEAATADPKRGFEALFDERGNGRIPQLGVSFGTKFLYFAGYHAGHDPPPLIYDMNVYMGLRAVNGQTPVHPQRLSGKDYAAYLQFAAAQGERFGVTPEVIEFGLFRAPRRIRRRQILGRWPDSVLA